MMKTATKKPSSKVASSSSNNNPKKTTPTTGETPEDCSETSVLSTSSSEEVKEKALQKKHKHKTNGQAVALQGTTMDYLKHPEQRRTVKPKTKTAKSSSKHKSKKKTSSSSSNNKEKAFSSSPKEKAAVTSSAHPPSPVLKRPSVVPPQKQMRHLPKQLSNKELDATHHHHHHHHRPRMIKSHSSPALSDDEGEPLHRPLKPSRRVAAMQSKPASLRNLSSSSTANSTTRSSSSSLSSRPLLDDFTPTSSPRSISNTTGRRFVQLHGSTKTAPQLVSTDDTNHLSTSYYHGNETSQSKSATTTKPPVESKPRGAQQAMSIAQKLETYHKYARKHNNHNHNNSTKPSTSETTDKETTSTTDKEPTTTTKLSKSSNNSNTTTAKPTKERKSRRRKGRRELVKSFSSPALSDDDDDDDLPRALRPSQVTAMQQKQQSLRNLGHDASRKLSTGHPDRPLMNDSIKMLHDQHPLQTNTSTTNKPSWREKRAAWLAEAHARRAQEQAAMVAAKQNTNPRGVNAPQEPPTSSQQPKASSQEPKIVSSSSSQQDSKPARRPLRPSQIAAMHRKSASLRSFGSQRSLGSASVRTSVTDRPLLDDFGPPATERSYSRSSRNFHTYQDTKHTHGDDPNNRKSFIDAASISSSSSVANVDPLETPNFHGSDQRRTTLLGSNTAPDPALSPAMSLTNPQKPYFVSAQLGTLTLPTFHDDDEDNSVAMRNPYLTSNAGMQNDDDATLESHDQDLPRQSASCPSSPVRTTRPMGLVKATSDRDLLRQRLSNKDNPYARSLVSDDFSTGGFTPI